MSINSKNIGGHMQLVHGEKEEVMNRCLEPLCTASFHFKVDLITHLEEQHQIHSSKQELIFDSFQDFEEWLRQKQRENNSQYYRRTRRRRTDGSEIIYYDCNRSGKSRECRAPRQRASKAQGSSKINAGCTSHCKVTVGEKTNVVFWATHYGHGQEIKHLELTKAERECLAGQMSLGLPVKTVLNSVRENVGSEVKRSDLITRIDLHNIRKEFNLNIFSGQRHVNDSCSVDIFVQESLKLGEQNPVIFYKKQGDESHELSRNDFCIVLMNEAQKHMLIKFSRNAICIDGTHGLNGYDFELTTVLVLDDYNEGFPVFFMFSNRRDCYIYELLFMKIKERTGSLYTKFFMSDITETYYMAWKSIMGEPGHRLLCLWHVFKAWTENSSKIKNAQKRAKVMSSLKILHSLPHQKDFSRALEDFCEECAQDPETQNFGLYFGRYYRSIPQLWAKCFRIGCDVSTNMHLERVHRTIKYEYLGGVRVKRLDKSIHALLQLVRDKEFDRIQKLIKGKHHKYFKEFEKRHETALAMQEGIIHENEYEWKVGMYHVERKLLENCCQLLCDKCKICVHAFSCTCLDYLTRTMMCKHVHYCIMHLPQNLVSTSQQALPSSLGNDGCLELQCHMKQLHKPAEATPESIMEEIKKTIQVTIGKLELLQNDKDKLKEVLKQLKAVEGFTASLCSNDSQKETCFTPTQTVECEPPNKKVQKQSFFSTKKSSIKKLKKNEVQDKTIASIIVHPQLYHLQEGDNEHNYAG